MARLVLGCRIIYVSFARGGKRDRPVVVNGLSSSAGEKMVWLGVWQPSEGVEVDVASVRFNILWMALSEGFRYNKIEALFFIYGDECSGDVM